MFLVISFITGGYDQNMSLNKTLVRAGKKIEFQLALCQVTLKFCLPGTLPCLPTTHNITLFF